MRYILLTLLVFFSTLHSSELEKVSLQLKWKYQFQFAGFLMAKEKGFYKDAGLDVTIKEFEENIDIVENVRNDIVDFGVSDSSLIYDKLNGKKLSAIMAIFQHSPFVLLGLQSSGITTLQDARWSILSFSKGIDGIAIQTMLKSNKIDYIPHPPIFSLDKLISGEVDMMAAYISNEPYIAKLKNLDIVTFAPKDYGFEGYGDILFTSQVKVKTHPKTVYKMYEASYKGWEYAFTHIDETVDILYSKYNTLGKTKESLKYEADKLKALSGHGVNFGALNEDRIKSIGQLFNLLKHESNKLSNLDNFIYNPNIEGLNFSQEEKEYIEIKKEINVCLRGNHKPFVIKEEKKYSGVSIDYLDIISQKTALNINYIYNDAGDAYYKNIKNSKCDLGALVVTKPNVHDFLSTTTPYITDSIVMATKTDESYISDISTLTDEKIMMQKDYINLMKYVKSLYPNLNIVPVDNFDLKRVTSGEFYACINPHSRIAYMIATTAPYNIKIMATISEKKLDGSFGVSNTEPLLLSILNKSIQSIPDHTIDKLERLYSVIKIEKQVNYVLIFQIVFISLIIILIILFFYFKQRKLGKALREEKEKFENIFYKASDGVSILSNGHIIDCNDALVHILGYKNKEQVLHLTPSELSPKYQPDGKSSLNKSIHMRNIAKEHGVNNFEWKLLKADGRAFWADVVLTNISTKRDEIIIHAVWRDIQFKKEMENELLELNTNLENRVKLELEKNKKQQFMLMQQSRLAQMGEMISMIAHQWRQPLNTLSLITQGMQMKYKKSLLNNENMQVFDQNTKKQITQMSSTIDDFQNFFKPQVEKSVFDISETINHVLGLILPIFSKAKVHIELQLKDNISINGYSNELGQVLINILNNAKDAMEEQGSTKQKLIKISTMSDEDTILITIEDNAGGIQEDIIDKIFDPYFSTKLDRNGTGIGLHMSKMIIEEHMQGTLGAANCSHGAIFTITLKKI